MAQSVEQCTLEPSWLPRSGAEALEEKVGSISTKLGMLKHDYPGLEFMDELLESADLLISYVYNLHNPAAMREIYISQHTEYHSQGSNSEQSIEAYFEQQTTLSYVKTNLEKLTSIYDDIMRHLLDPDVDGVRLRIHLLNQSRIIEKLRTELGTLTQQRAEQKAKITRDDQSIAQLSEQLGEAHRRIETQSKGSAEERKFFADYKRTTSKVSTENENLRLELVVWKSRNLALQEAADAELDNRKKLDAELEGTQKDLQLYKMRLEEAEKRVSDKDNQIQLLICKHAEIQEKLEASQKAIETAEQRSILEASKLRQQLQEAQTALSTAHLDIYTLGLEKESMANKIVIFASQFGLERLPGSPVTITQSLPRIRSRIESESEINANIGGISSDVQSLAHSQAIMDPVFENDFSNNNMRPRSDSRAHISSEMEDTSMWGTADFQNSAIADDPNPQRSQSLSIPRRSNDWIRPEIPLRQANEGNRTPEGCYRVNAHFKRYPQRRD